MAEQGDLKRIAVDKLDLDLENPRHGKLLTPEAAITHLIEKERVIELAIDIARKGGTNPMDLLGVVKRKGSSKSEVYFSAEGNRRVCALMLLHDPEKVPKGVLERAKKIRALEAAVATSPLPKSVNCIVFSSKKDAMPWIELMHIADQDGRARKRWSPDQQANALDDRGRNSDAMQVLDQAQVFGLIDKSERDLKLTTVQRYLSNPTMRIALGLERTKDKALVVRLPHDEFAKLFSAFLDDVRSGELSSRSDSDDIKEYAAKLMNRVPCDRTLAPAYPLAMFRPAAADQSNPPVPADPAPVVDPEPAPAPQAKTPVRQTIGRNATLDTALFALKSQKLTSLYVSCVQLSLKDHAPLITVGLWSLLESLAALHAEEAKKFIDYFTANFFTHHLGIADKDACKNIRAAIVSIDARGNATKHHSVAASFDGRQLANDFDVLVPFLIAICANIPK
jgi:hypothetical protein